MESALLDGLPPLYRLALSYAPVSAKARWMDLLALDARLAAILQQGRDPVLVQIRLAWWRERLGQAPDERPLGEPLLARLSQWDDGGMGLIALIDGWESLLGEPPLVAETIEQFGESRVKAVALLASEIGAAGASCENLVKRWSFADLACHFGSAEERLVASTCHSLVTKSGLPARKMRPLLVLERVFSRAIGKGGASALTTPGSLLTALKAGLLGR